MKISIEVEGKQYIPIAAVPYITGGFFTSREVVLMAAVPGMFAQAYGSTALDAFEFLSFGRLTYVSEQKLSSVAEICMFERQEPPLTLIAGMVVPEMELRDLMRIVPEVESATQAPWRERPTASWDLEAPLPLPVGLAIFKNLPIEMDLTIPRENSAQTKSDRILDAVERISRYAAQHNIPFDRTNLPGRKIDFIKILHKIDARIGGAPATLDRYFEQLNLRWRQGSKRNDAAPLLALYGLTVD